MYYRYFIIVFAFLLLWFNSVRMTHSDIYKCFSEKGFIIFSDEPCGKNSKLFISQQAKTVDDELEIAIDSFINKYSVDSYKEYIVKQAERIGQRIFPGCFLNTTEVIKVQGPRPSDSILFPRPKSIYGSDPCWVVILNYGPHKNHRKLKIELRFFNKYAKGADDIDRVCNYLRFMKITNENIPFIPETMIYIEKMKMVKKGYWIDSEWLQANEPWIEDFQ